MAFVLAAIGALMLLAGLAGLAHLVYTIDQPPLLESRLARGMLLSGPVALIPLSVWAILATLLRTQTQNEAILRLLGGPHLSDISPRLGGATGHRATTPGEPMVQVRPMSMAAASRPDESAGPVAPRPNPQGARLGAEGTLLLPRPVNPNLLRLWEQATADTPPPGATPKPDAPAETPPPGQPAWPKSPPQDESKTRYTDIGSDSIG